MAKKSQRVLGVRTATNPSGFGQSTGGPSSLQALISMIHQERTTRVQRRAQVGEKVLHCLLAREADGGIYLCLTATVPEDLMAVVPHEAEEVLLVAPPDQSDFLDGDLFVFVRGNTVVYCSAGLRERALATYVEALGVAIGLDPTVVSMALQKRVNVDRVVAIQREGVKSIRLDAVAHAASVDEAQQHVRRRILGGIVDEVRALIGSDLGDVPAGQEDVMVEVYLSFDKRKGVAVAQDRLVSLATAVAEDEDSESGFVIETLKGNKFRSDDVVLSKKVTLPRYGKSVYYEDAWASLRAFADEVDATRSSGGG